MAEAAFKQMIATLIRQTRPQTFRHGKPPRYPQRSIATTATVTPETGEPQTRLAWQAHPIATIDSEYQSPSRPRLEKLRTEPDPRTFSSFLTDNYSREHNYLRISLTERCNLRCLYCMPEEGVPLSPPDHILTTPEIVYLSSLFVSQGVDKIRLTGGEPTVRKDILDLMHQIGQLRANGLKELCITTNGISLHRKLDSMLESGLTGVNLSLDTLDPFQFTIMTRRNGHEAVMKSINRILDMNKVGAGIKLKINCVVMRGLNDQEIISFVELGKEKDLEVRFIEYMPFDGNKWSQNKMMSFQEMLAMIRQQYPTVHQLKGHTNDTSKTYKIPGFAGRIGFITSMTDNFCGTCNRLRITSDGNLKVCLFGNSEVSLRDILREFNHGKPIDTEAMEAIKQIESDRKQALQGSTGPSGVSEREAKLLEVIGAAVKRKKAKHADNGLHARTDHIAYRIQSPLRTESALQAIRSNLAFSRSIPTHLLSHSSQSFLSQQQRYRSTFLLRRTYITKKSTVRTIFHVPTHRHYPFDPWRRLQKIIHQESIKHELSRAVQITRPCRRRSHHRSASPPRAASPRRSMGQRSLSHLTSSGEAHMVSISHKIETLRKASAVCNLIFSQSTTYEALQIAKLRKGDAMAVARIAGIQAAKKTADLIPLAHPALGITGVTVDIAPFPPDSKKLARQKDATKADSPQPESKTTDSPNEEQADHSTEQDDLILKTRHGGVRVTATVECCGKTGVEMEALTAAHVTTLTMYDMLKGIDKTMTITASRVVEKRGGKSGSWRWNRSRGQIERLNDATAVVGPSTYNTEGVKGDEFKTDAASHTSPTTTTAEEIPSTDNSSLATNLPPNNPQSTTNTARTDSNDNDNAQSILEAEWTNLTTSFSQTTPQSQVQTPTDSDPDPGQQSDPEPEPEPEQGPRWPVTRTMLSGPLHGRISSDDLFDARVRRYERWKKDN